MAPSEVTKLLWEGIQTNARASEAEHHSGPAGHWRLLSRNDLAFGCERNWRVSERVHESWCVRQLQRRARCHVWLGPEGRVTNRTSIPPWRAVAWNTRARALYEISTVLASTQRAVTSGPPPGPAGDFPWSLSAIKTLPAPLTGVDRASIDTCVEKSVVAPQLRPKTTTWCWPSGDWMSLSTVFSHAAAPHEI